MQGLDRASRPSVRGGYPFEYLTLKPNVGLQSGIGSSVTIFIGLLN